MLSIKDVVDDVMYDNNFYIEIQFYIDYVKDAYILQDYIRAKMHQYCVESSYGYDENFEEILEVEYKCKPYLNILRVEYLYSQQIIKSLITYKK